MSSTTTLTCSSSKLGLTLLLLAGQSRKEATVAEEYEDADWCFCVGLSVADAIDAIDDMIGYDVIQ